MDTLAQILAGAGVLAGVMAFFAAGVFFFVQPLWAIIDCIDSDRESDAKVLVTIALVFTWGFGSLIYGVFFPKSLTLRSFTLWMLAVLALLMVASFAACITGGIKGGQERERQEAERSAELERRAAAFQPAAIAGDALGRFHAVHQSGASRTLAEFTLSGPVAAGARDLDARVRHVTHDSIDDRVFAISDHKFGSVSATSGRFAEIEVDPALERLSWPHGIAFDPQEHRVYVMSSHVFTRFYRYDPRRSEWERLPGELRDLGLLGLALDPDARLLYAVAEPEDGVVTRLERFNLEGAHVGSVELEAPVLAPDEAAKPIQLAYGGGQVVLILPDGGLYAVDPSDGRLAVAQ